MSAKRSRTHYPKHAMIKDYRISHVGAQLTSIIEPVCPGDEAVLLCEQGSLPLRWRVSNIAGTGLSLERTFSSLQSGETFSNDPGYGFMISLTTTSSGSIESFLRVNAVRELNGAQVECTNCLTTLQIDIVGKQLNSFYMYESVGI